MSSSLSLGDTIREANSEAVKRILEAEPVLVDVVKASEVIPDLEEGMILHACLLYTSPSPRDRG